MLRELNSKSLSCKQVSSLTWKHVCQRNPDEECKKDMVDVQQSLEQHRKSVGSYQERAVAPREHPDWRKQGGHHSAKHYSRKILIYLFIRRHLADLPVTVKSDATCLPTPTICYLFNPCTTLFTLEPAGHALVLYTIFCEVLSQKTWFFEKLGWMTLQNLSLNKMVKFLWMRTRSTTVVSAINQPVSGVCWSPFPASVTTPDKKAARASLVQDDENYQDGHWEACKGG